MAGGQTIVDVFEQVLQLPFEPQYMERLSPDIALIRKLAESLTNYYREFKVPPKQDNELRPYLFHRYTTGLLLWDTYVRFEGSTYKVNTSAPSMESMIKPYLLYSHSLCILDPLPGLLDYFRFATGAGSSLERDRMPGVVNLLQQYALVADLIRHRILIPLSPAETFGHYDDNVFWLTNEERDEIGRLPKELYAVAGSDVSMEVVLAQLVKEQLWIAQRSGNELDLYFPTRHYVPILRGLLKSAQKHYSSADLREPFDAGLLGSVSNIDSTKISIEDIVRVRKEEVFESFRTFLRHAFQRIHQREGEFSSEQAELSRAIRDELNENEARIKEMTQKSRVLKDVLSNTDRILLGALTGSIGGMMAGSPNLAVLGAAAGGAIRPVYDIVRGLLSRSSSEGARASLRNHFLALDAGKSSA